MSAIPDRRPVVLALHGFTLGGAMFDELAGQVAARFVAPDLPGHGGRGATSCSWPDAVAEVLDLIDAHQPEVVLGYSMGGRLAVASALESPRPFTAVFASSGVGISDPIARAERRSADEDLAASLEVMGEAEFLSRWESDEQLGGHPALAPIRRANTAVGLAESLRGMGQGAQPYLGDRLGAMPRRTMWLVGEHDPRYLTIAQEAVAAAPNAKLVVVAGARHNVVAGAPLSVAAALAEVLATQQTV